MKSNNPKSSLIKKITGYRTLNTPNNQNIKYNTYNRMKNNNFGLNGTNLKYNNFTNKNASYNNNNYLNKANIGNQNNLFNNYRVNNNVNKNNPTKRYDGNQILANIGEINFFEDDDLNNIHNKTFNFGKKKYFK
jgi:hypothetical protein